MLGLRGGFWSRCETTFKFDHITRLTIVDLTSFWPDCRYMSIHLLFEMIGKWTSLRTGDIDPYSDLLPQPVTVPVLPTNKLLVDGKQIGIIFGCKDKADDSFFSDFTIYESFF